MRRRATSVQSLLGCIQDATRRYQTNAYQIAKATGLPLRSIQKILDQQHNPTLRNVEAILNGFGLVLYVQTQGPVTIKPGKRRKPARKATSPSP